jgi:hypothetical protein
MALPEPYQGGRSAAQSARLAQLAVGKTPLPSIPALGRTHNECAPCLQVGQAPVSEIARFTFVSGLLSLLAANRR